MTTTTVPPTESAATVRTWLSAFSDALAPDDTTEAAALFTEDCFWRDLLGVQRAQPDVHQRGGPDDVRGRALHHRHVRAVLPQRAADVERGVVGATTALRLKARQAGIPTPVYGRQEVHHLG